MNKNRVLLASLSGSVIEWYDFYLYGTATGLVFSTLFFSGQDPSIALLLAFATFGIGYAARPIGSIIFGHFGDRIGRKATLMWTLIGMGGSSFLIGLLPTYNQVGLLAPILLVVLRLIQGISLGGEWGGAVLLATESAPKGRRGLYGSVPQLGVPLGLVAGSFSLTLIAYLTTDAQFLAWGWRIPFLFSAVLIVLALWIRGGIEETSAFQKQKESGEIAKVPIVETLGYSNEIALTALTIGCATMIITIPVVGYISDFIGRKVIYISGLVLMFLLAIPYFFMIEQGATWLYYMQAAMLGIIWAAIFATQGTLFSELFPAKVRYTGLSFGYQMAAAIVGFGPMLWTTMVDSFGPSHWVFGGFMMGGLTLSLVLSLFVPNTKNVSQYEESIEKFKKDNSLQI
ncbi:MFS transporter [Bacillus sp. Soil768D1]|nr:MFS transporter [Bacillus sp. Soil768D1]